MDGKVQLPRWLGLKCAAGSGRTRREVYAERPRLTSAANGETLLAFRRFGQPDSNAWLGQIALVQRRASSSSYSAPLLLTDEPRQNWQAALALNPANNQIVVAKIGSAPIMPANTAANPLMAQLTAQSTERFAWTNLAGKPTSLHWIFSPFALRLTQR